MRTTDFSTSSIRSARFFGAALAGATGAATGADAGFAAGAAAAWKFRAQAEARNIAWRHLFPRGGEFADYRPPEWQRPKQAAWGSAPDDPNITAAAFEMPIVRGPVGNFTIRSDVFDPTKGLQKGTGYISRKFPMLPKMRPYQFTEENYVLYSQWQFREQGQGSNFYHRMNVLYNIPQASNNQLSQATQQAASVHNSTPLQPLDQDAELAAWFGHYFNFYPRLRTFTSLDVNTVDQRYVQPLIRQIEGNPNGRRRRAGLPQQMTQTFLSMYRQMQNTLMPPPAGLQTYIDQLNDFLSKL